MRPSIPRRLFIGVGVVALVIALPAIAQQRRGPVTRTPVLVENPYRTSGGSCIYGRNGELVYAPKGVACASRQESAPDQTATSLSDRLAALSPALRKERTAILGGHSHIAAGLAELRPAVAQDRKDDALVASDHVVREPTDQLMNEQLLFEELSKEPDAEGS